MLVEHDSRNLPDWNPKSMNTARIAELLEPFFADGRGQSLRDAELTEISAYLDLLLRWNARINLTAIRGPQEIVTRHFGESFFAAQQLFPARNKPTAFSASQSAQQFSLADLGSGAGFPGIPIKLWAQQVSLTLFEANHKKAVFLREVCRALKLNDADVENLRAEETGGAAFTAVTMRAVERFADVLPTAGKLVAVGGRLALLISAAQVAMTKSTLPQFHWDEPLPIPLSKSRVCLIGTNESR